jgi:Uma2 family endonuclease
MSTALSREDVKTAVLVEGQRLDQPTFHAIYEAMPPGTRAELIGEVVWMPSPLGNDHSRCSVDVLFWLKQYARYTPGVEPQNNATVILDKRNEPQPDAGLRILPEFGGRTRNEGRYIGGAPELLVEVARSSRSLDLGPKLDEYGRAGVLEYIVWALEPDELYWFVRDADRLIERTPDPDGLHRSGVFPGLWLDPLALLRKDIETVLSALDRGLASLEHAAFVAALEAKKAR